MKGKELKGKDRWFFRGEVRLMTELGGWRVIWVQDGDSEGVPKSELEVLVQYGKQLNPSSWQPGASQTPAQLLALRFSLPQESNSPAEKADAQQRVPKPGCCQDKVATLARDASHLQRALPLCTVKGRNGLRG